ncbi:Asp-tRNA(Asn)/Glu-tRNA(Gln) amidotransferase subunit GatC [Candidatus Peregrinibacteria bacterium]|nr:Asp-tRNA(Asn)/Glu-tRNA(Gln) amidotransferase subunit GatC [Candidatus Peregrinibacteria bacterium]
MIFPEEIRKIATLGYLELTEAEVEKYSKELSEILGFFEALQEVNTEGIIPTAQVTGLHDVLREDIFENCEYSEKLLTSSPNPIHKSQIQVKAAL